MNQYQLREYMPYFKSISFAIIFASFFGNINGFAEEAEGNCQNEESSCYFDESLISQESIETCYSNLSFSPVLIPFAGYRGGEGLSYNGGYETLGAFLAFYQYLNRSYPFVEAEFHRVDDGQLALNTGIGWRVFSKSYDSMVGAYVFYDYRHFSEGHLQQIGLGLELLGKCWDVRVNGYIPFGDNRKIFKDQTVFDFSDGFFAERDKFISALWGVDVELGMRILCCKYFSLYAALGPYGYSTGCCCSSLIGGMGRLEAWICDFLRFQFFITHDHIFQTNVQGEVALTLTLPKAMKCLRCLFPLIYRNRIIVVEDTCCWSANY